MSDLNPVFSGPVFIVGMPRSGTKLLRGIINEHPDVIIPNIETEFLPFWADNWETFGDLSNRQIFQSFYSSCQKLPFFVYLQDSDNVIDSDSWYEACEDFSVARVFEALIRVHLKLKADDTTIWGDKSPSYLTHIQTLKSLFPQSRIIHIIRDVRDHCLSMNKTWGKNMLRAAQRWSDDVSAARRAGTELGDSYFEIRYEDLLHNPREWIRRVCEFLDLSFDARLLELSASTENIGDAKDSRKIVEANVRKYECGLDSSTRTKIEAIAVRTLIAAGYDCAYTGNIRRLGPLHMRYLQLLDGISLILFAADARGLGGAIGFVYHYFLISGNRRKPNV